MNDWTSQISHNREFPILGNALMHYVGGALRVSNLRVNCVGLFTLLI